ncbi:MAG: NADH-quinone oxidoreductase subunit J [Candidatus Omnitrophica bacterium]|nr:NADH-quinone oxidoreductase subunit J [Candidatus Omnitrophota bacterium]
MASIEPLHWAGQALFYVIAALTLAGAVITVWARNLFRAALGLAVCLFGVAVLYLYLQAEFLAAVQLLIYVGAILTLLIFGVMLTARIADPKAVKWNSQVKWAALAAGLLWLGISVGIQELAWPSLREAAAVVSLQALGRSLVSVYLLPFELLSVLLLGALVGAVVIARRESE